METSRKVILAIALVINVAAIGVTTAVVLHGAQPSSASPTLLDAVVANTGTNPPAVAELATITVKPSAADWQYAEAHGLRRPASATIALAPITVYPTQTQLADLAQPAELGADQRASQTPELGDLMDASLVEALKVFAPGQLLNVNADLNRLNTLVFERSGG